MPVKIFITIFLFLSFPRLGLGDVKSSKASGYAVVGPVEGVSISKSNGYAIIAPNKGVSASKANGYAIISPMNGISVSKALGYAVISPATIQQPSIFIITDNRTPGAK